jgi:hypothetical protein
MENIRKAHLEAPNAQLQNLRVGLGLKQQALTRRVNFDLAASKKQEGRWRAS